MHQHIEEAARRLGIVDEVAHLRKAAEYSEDQIRFCRDWLRTKIDPASESSDVVAFGSLARHEFTQASDFDYLVVAHQLDPRPRGPRDLLETADGLRREMTIANARSERSEVPEPGGTKLFGVVVSASDISERIGLQSDTNHDQTRRLLLLEESVSLLQPERHRILVRSIIERYLHGYAGGTKAGVPRFLLNDVVRYWRTLTVDYQAKVWGSSAGGWGLRYLKLVVSRKLAYAGTLASLLSCSPDRPATVEHLLEQFEMPPLARLAQLHTCLSGDDRASTALASALRAADTFVDRAGDKTWRDRVKQVQDLSTAAEVGEFEKMREAGRRLQEDLETIFFDSAALRDGSRRYLSF